MALSNSQYNAIMREYEQQQVRNRHDQEARIARVYERIPQIQELDVDTGARAAACARRILGGDAGARHTLREELEDIREQKRILLAAAGFPEDYMELRYRCPDCKDTGYVDGKHCHCFEQARISVLYAQSNIREVLERENFETLSYTYYDDSHVVPGIGVSELEYMKLVIRQCRDFAEHFPDRGKNILFTGSTGVGKTFLTNCIARCLIERYKSVIYLSSQDLFEVLSRYRFGREAEEGVGDTYHYILDCDMLIIDDLGTELNNAFVSSQLFYCINERISRGHGTVISTNLSMGMLRDTYSDRVTSRIMSHYTTIPLYGPDIRLMKNGINT
ncbi:MAG: ATP-binding protein [Lachnospiraceae bacterium]|nr:ATP-binding protein [Lachnospiraceae bacterium]